jgi:hypothetical protein
VPTETIQAVIDRALDAYVALAELGESIEDEWSYVTDLTDAWRTRLELVSDQRGIESAAEEHSAAIDRAIDQLGRISDAHRAIDWLSTFPQVVLVTLGEAP